MSSKKIKTIISSSVLVLTLLGLSIVGAVIANETISTSLFSSEERIVGKAKTMTSIDESDQAAFAVKDENSDFVVDSVEKESDGTYKVQGSLDGESATFHVSSDLETVHKTS